jgi:hypothetical protein
MLLLPVLPQPPAPPPLLVLPPPPLLLLLLLLLTTTFCRQACAAASALPGSCGCSTCGTEKLRTAINTALLSTHTRNMMSQALLKPKSTRNEMRPCCGQKHAASNNKSAEGLCVLHCLTRLLRIIQR